MEDCIFCKIVEKKVPSNIIKETDELLVIEDIAPKAELHYLIIPKRHVKDLVSLDSKDLHLGAEIFKIAQELAKISDRTKEFRLAINNGARAGQVIFHFHVHFLAGEFNPDFRLSP